MRVRGLVVDMGTHASPDTRDSHASFDNLSMWLSEARQNSNNPNLVVMMIGNKTDLADAYVRDRTAFCDSH